MLGHGFLRKLALILQLCTVRPAKDPQEMNTAAVVGWGTPYAAVVMITGGQVSSVQMPIKYHGIFLLLEDSVALTKTPHKPTFQSCLSPRALTMCKDRTSPSSSHAVMQYLFYETEVGQNCEDLHQIDTIFIPVKATELALPHQAPILRRKRMKWHLRET